MDLAQTAGRKAQIGWVRRAPLRFCPRRPHQPSCRGARAGATQRGAGAGLGTRNNHASRRRAKRPPGGAQHPLKMLKMKDHPGMCMKTNEPMRQFARQKRRLFCLVACYFTQKYTYFVPTDSSFAIIRALGNAPPASKWRGARGGSGARSRRCGRKARAPLYAIYYYLSTALFPTPTSCRERASRPWPNPRQP